MKRAVVAMVLLIGCRDAAVTPPTPAAGVSPRTAAQPALQSSALVGPTSLDELGRTFIDALKANDRKALERLFLTPPEYSALVYPELVKAGEPLISSMGLAWAWDNLEHSSRKDMKRLLDELGGKKLAFKSIETATQQPRGGLGLYPKVVVHGELDGKPIDVRAIFAIVARDGHYRVLRYRANRED